MGARMLARKPLPAPLQTCSRKDRRYAHNMMQRAMRHALNRDAGPTTSPPPRPPPTLAPAACRSVQLQVSLRAAPSDAIRAHLESLLVHNMRLHVTPLASLTTNMREFRVRPVGGAGRLTTPACGGFRVEGGVRAPARLLTG